MELSVIIPTHRRAAILQETLACLSRQTVVDQLEVIVVSDGEDPDAKEVCAGQFPFPLRYEEIAKSHQGVARNRGVALATGKRVLFIGDDIFLDPAACAIHCTGEQAAFLGFTTWDPASGINDVMRWLERSGWQFGYNDLSQYADYFIPTAIQHRYTYTSHISLPLATAKAIPFREDVSLYGWEDTEWGLRLAQAGISLVYQPKAKAWHHHHLELADSLARMETLGKSAVAMERLNPALRITPRGLKRLAYQFAACLPTLAGKHRTAWLRGIAQAS